MTRPGCTWCGKPAGGRVKAKDDRGRPVDITYCDPESPCWDRTYDQVRRYMPRTWTPIETGQPDLFDLLPTEG